MRVDLGGGQANRRKNYNAVERFAELDRLDLFSAARCAGTANWGVATHPEEKGDVAADLCGYFDQSWGVEGDATQFCRTKKR